MRALVIVAMLIPSAALAQLSPIRPEPMVPALWAPSRGNECWARERGTQLPSTDVCDGPRRVPVAEGEAAERAERLGLGTHAAVDRVYIGRPPAEWVREIPSAPASDLLWPVARGLFSQGFGHTRRQEIRHIRHPGVDIVAEPGAHIRAANDGLVVYADNGVRGFGNLLVIVHADATATFYAHCRAIYAAPGQLVLRGQTVAEVGRTGRPFIEHLHFEWRRNGEPMDPSPRFVERPEYEEIRPDGGRTFAPPPPNVRTPEAEGAALANELPSRDGGEGAVQEEGIPAARATR
jgi:murein DD-endopeptidase MepM/ murein hydrolase activator NlpD